MLITERPSISAGTSMHYCNKNKVILPLITKLVLNLSVTKSDVASMAHRPSPGNWQTINSTDAM